jgi:hypothetical protein
VTAPLTLLFVRNPGEIYSPFPAALRAAAPRLLVEHRTEEIKVLLSREPVAAILLDQDHLQDCVLAELKRIAPRTPLILLRRPNQQVATKPPGIAAVCCVDPRDEKLLHAVPIFLGFSLGKLVLNFRNHYLGVRVGQI